MYKLPYEYVFRQVDKLYEKHFYFDELDPEDIDRNDKAIGAFIRACGWTEEEFIRAIFERGIPSNHV